MSIVYGILLCHRSRRVYDDGCSSVRMWVDGKWRVEWSDFVGI
jgi:hypothetical protein